MDPLALGLLGSCIVGAIVTSGSLGIFCAFGRKWCAYSGHFGDEKYDNAKRDLAHLGGHDIPILLQVHNSGLRRIEVQQLYGLKANVLDSVGHAVFSSPNLAAVEGFIVASDHEKMGKTAALPDGLAQGAFNLTIPGADVYTDDTPVEGTWLAMNPAMASDKVQDIFNQLHHAMIRAQKSEPLDVKEYLIAALEHLDDPGTIDWSEATR